MKRRCEKCREIYDDFNCVTYCPHEKFVCSESARAMLIKSGIDPDTGERLQ